MKSSSTAQPRAQNKTSECKRYADGTAHRAGKMSAIIISCVLTALSSEDDTFLSPEHIAADTMPIALV